MAILDNLVFRLKPQAGSATPANEVGAGEVLTGGTIALVDTGANGWAWRFTGAASAVALPSKYVNVSVNSGGVTVAMRIRRAVVPTVLGQTMVAWDNGAASAGMIVREGSSVATDIQFRALFSSAQTAFKLAVATSVTETYVFKLEAATTSLNDKSKVWWTTVGRVGTAADHASAGDSLTAQTLSRIIVDPTNSGDYYIHDLVLWGRELTDAECAAVADDLRGTLDVAAPSDLSGGATLDDVGASGTLTSSGSSDLSGSATLDGVGASGVLGVAPGVLTTPVLKNNTGTVLASVTGIVANIYHPTTGALIVRKTGLSSDGSGIVTITDAALVGGTTYAYELDLSATTQGRRLPTGVAS